MARSEENPLIDPLKLSEEGSAWQGQAGAMDASKTTHPGPDTVTQEYHTGSAQPWRSSMRHVG